MRTYKIRASRAGAIMTNPRTKSEEISQTAKTAVEDWLKFQIYGFQKEIRSKYLSKGNDLEDMAIDSAIDWLDLDMVLKNKDLIEDEYFIGTPDIILPNEVIDIKCSWDAYTFPLFDTEIPTKDYFYQLQVYMHLTGKKASRLVYVLLNTPEHLTYETPRDYDSLDKKYRIKTFDVAYDPEVILELQEKVKKIRVLIQERYEEA